MNPMIAALQKSRADATPSAPVGPVPGNPVDSQPSGNPGDMQKYWLMMQDMNAKLDKVLASVGGHEAPKDGVKENNDNGRDSGY